MSHPYIHAEHSVRRYGGEISDYLPLHHWYDATKAWHPDWRHRAFRHHIEGIRECVEIFGKTLVNRDGKSVDVYQIGIDHVTEDIGFVPNASEWFEEFDALKWAKTCQKKKKERSEMMQGISQHLPSRLSLEKKGV